MDFFERLLPGMFTALEFHCMRFWKHWLVVLGVIVIGLGVMIFLLRAPMNFSSTTLVIDTGDSAAKVAQELAAARVITSPLSLRLVLRISGGDNKLHEGVYLFNSPENVFSIARRLVSADYGLPSARITFPEGVTTRDIAAQVALAFPAIEAEAFEALAKPQEGYLFPDTYVFPASATAASIIATMRANFDTRTASLKDEVVASGHSLADIVTMASLVEKEARTDENRRLVAGVLWNRLAKGMRLQVDVVFGYIFGRDTYSPSPRDLTVDSPYNTYTHAGLPPGPINNPGLEALEAAVNPTKTSYLYYLTGKDNLMHYATTYAAHQANLAKYLK
jgi:UPF0755 protein